ncbi:MAG: MATE family efflux transporter [Bulleidia sp.]
MAKRVDLAEKLQKNEEIPFKERMNIVYRLSLPGILAQIAEIIMQYIDAAMVGVLGAAASASIGLVASATWLFGGIISGAVNGFSVQIAQAIGAGDHERSGKLYKQAVIACLVVALITGGIGVLLSLVLPKWLGAEQALWHDATMYFMLFSLFIPVRCMQNLGVAALQCVGNMKVPSILSAAMCGLDVIFNFFLIFPTRVVSIAGMTLTMPGAGLGVAGAQLGTSLSFVVCAVLIHTYIQKKEKRLSVFHSKGRWIPESHIVREAVRIGVPMALEHSATSGAQIVSTRIVAPLGTIAIAANSFAVTAESICYMPGFGIASAATTMVGQAIGAKRKDLARSFAWLTTFSGMVIMGITGTVMFFACPYVFRFLTPDVEVQQLGASVLRIELMAEPLFAASIVASGALRGAKDTLVPGVINLVSMWGIRLTLAFLLVRKIGLYGVWIAMAIELSARGILFLIRLKREKWLEKAIRSE